MNGRRVHVVDCYVSEKSIDRDYSPDDGDSQSMLVCDMLSQTDKTFLEGMHGEAACISMRIVLRMADLLEVRELMEIAQVHVDGSVYTGPDLSPLQKDFEIVEKSTRPNKSELHLN